MSVSITHKILRNTGWNFIARIIHIPVSIGLIPFIIGRVGTEWYGVWVALFAIVDYFSLLDLGMGAATIKYVAEYHASGNLRKIGDVVLSTCLFNLVFLPPLALAYVFADEILSIFQVAPKDFGDARLIFDWVLLNFAAAQISGVFRNTLIGLQRMHVSNLCEIAYLLAYTASTVIVLGAGAGLTGLIVVLFALRCGLTALQAVCLLHSLPQLTRHPVRVDTTMLREFFRYGLKLQTTSLAGLINFQFDKLLIGHFLRMEFVAFYELGSKLAATVRLVPSFLMGPMIPAASELAARQDIARLKELYWQGTRYMALLAAPVAGFLAANANLIITLWLGEGPHAYTALALQTLSIAYFFNIVTGAANSIGRGAGVLRYEMEATCVLSILNALLCVMLIIHLGFPGALIGTGLAMIIGNAFYLFRFSSFMQCDVTAVFTQVLAKPVGCAVAAGFGSYCVIGGIADAVATLGRPQAFLWLTASATVFAVVFFTGLLIIGGVSRSDVRLVRQALTATRSI